MSKKELYKNLYIELCDMIEEHGENSPVVEELRSQMDEVWAKLGYREVEQLKLWCAAQAVKKYND